MLEPQEHPTEQPAKKSFRFLKRLCLGLGILLLILIIGSWGTLNFWIVPRIDQYRPRLEQLASKQLGTTVQIKEIQAKRQGILPTITFSGVSILDTQGRTALTVDQVHAQISFTALLSFDLQFSSLILQNPQLRIERRDNNHILIAGIDITKLVNQQKKLHFEKSKEELPASVLWLLRQHHLQINQGQIYWSDHIMDAPDIAVTDLDFVINKKNKEHTLLLQATPPAKWGKRFTISAHFVEPPLSSNAKYMDWSGQAQALFPEANLEQLYRYIILPFDIKKGKGFVEVKAQYDNGEITKTTAHLNLSEVEIKTAEDAPSIHLLDLKSEITGSWIQQVYQLHIDKLSFRLAEQTLPNGNIIKEQSWQTGVLELSWKFDDQFKLNGGKLKTGAIDLAFLASFAHQLPLPVHVQKLLSESKPQGQIDYIDFQWDGPVDPPQSYQFKGRLSNLALTAAQEEPPAQGQKMKITRPGFENLNIEFSASEKAGEVHLTMKNGHVTIPGLFPDPTVPVTYLSTKGSWSFNNKKQAIIQVPSLELINDSAKINVQVGWTSPNPNEPEDRAGHIQIAGTLADVKLNDIPKYLPNSIMPKVRHYLKGALLSGTADQVQISVNGPLVDFPYHYKDTGTFLIEGNAKNVAFNYVPDAVRPSNQRPWLYLENISAHVRVTGKGLRLENITGQVQNAKDITIASDALHIDDWSKKDTHVIVNVESTGPLNQYLYFINHSGLGNIMRDMLSQSSATGSAKLQFGLDLHVENMGQSEVKGHVEFQNNSMTLWPFVPELKNVKGQLQFSEKGFSFPKIQANALGGPLKGNLQWDMKKGFDINLQGTLTADGIRNDANFKTSVSPAATHWLSGQTPYTVSAKTQNKQLALQIQSNLQGLVFNLPSPMKKAAQERYALSVKITPLTQNNQFLPMRVEIQTKSETDDIPDIHSTLILRQQKDLVQIKQAAIGLNASPPLPPEGIVAQANLRQMDIPGWIEFSKKLPQSPSSLPEGYIDASHLTLPPWWPQTTNAHIENLIVSDTVRIEKTEIHLTKQNLDWQASVSSPQAQGTIHWQHAAENHPQGLLTAKLERLWLPELKLNPIEKHSTTEQIQKQTFTLLPDSDLSIADLRFGKAELENIQLQAQMKSRKIPMRWEINYLTFNIGDTQVKAKGHWTKTKTPLTELNAKLESKNTATLLQKLDLPPVIANAPGTLEGTLNWKAAPYQFDRTTLRGNLDLHLEKGQFLTTEPGAGRLLSAFSLQSLPNRISMDFRDIFDKGLAFDQIDGHLTLQDGILLINAIKLNGVSAKIHMNGQLNLLNKSQKLKVIVEPEINAGAASLAITAFNPTLGVGSLVAQMILREPIRKALSRTYHVTGTWDKAEISTTTPEPSPIDNSNTVYKTKKPKTE